MPEEKLAVLAKSIDFAAEDLVWMDQIEHVLFAVLRYEYYLSAIPDNLTIPKYRTVLIRIISRILSQSRKHKPVTSEGLELMTPRIKRIMDYLVESDFKRRQNLLKRFPITEEFIKKALLMLKREREIW